MQNGIINVKCTQLNTEYVVDSVYQYDRGFKLHVSDISHLNVVEMQFGIDGIIQTIDKIPTLKDGIWSASIPDMLLTQKNTVYCYITTYQSGVLRTIATIKIPIIPRSKPSDYEFNNEELSQVAELMNMLSTSIKNADAANKKAQEIYNDFDALKQQMTRIEDAIKDNGSMGGIVYWESIEQKPEVYPPDAHKHNVEDIEGLADVDFGNGTVKSVNSVEPDANGNVELDADDVNAITVDLDEGYVGEDVIIKNNTELFDGKTYQQVKTDILSKVPVTSVNEKLGDVMLTASDIGAKPADWQPKISDIEGLTEQLAQAGRVQSVNGATGDVQLTADDVGARSKDWTPEISEIKNLAEQLAAAGKVQTVNEIQPDQNKNITLTAKDVGALYVQDETIMNGESAFSIAADSVKEDAMEEIYQYVLQKLQTGEVTFGVVKANTITADKVIGAVYA